MVVSLRAHTEIYGNRYLKGREIAQCACLPDTPEDCRIAQRRIFSTVPLQAPSIPSAACSMHELLKSHLPKTPSADHIHLRTLSCAYLAYLRNSHCIAFTTWIIVLPHINSRRRIVPDNLFDLLFVGTLVLLEEVIRFSLSW